MAKAMFVTKGGEYFPPTGIMQISATAKLSGHKTCLGVLSKEDVKKIEKENSDVVAYSGSTGEHRLYFKFNHKLKEKHPELKTIMGGPHAVFSQKGPWKTPVWMLSVLAREITRSRSS
jgi:hypothetical protein